MVNLEVIPLKNLKERCFLVLFENTEKSRSISEGSSHEQPSSAGKTTRVANQKQESRRVIELEAVLSETRDYLQAIQE